MAVQFDINLEKISLTEFKEILEKNELLPGRMLLKDGLQDNFARIQDQEIFNLKELSDLLKTKQKLSFFALKVGISTEYLTVLRREINSYLPKAIKLDKFIGVTAELICKMEEMGVKNSKQFFQRAASKAQRQTLSAEAGFEQAEIDVLASMVDLARVGGAGPAYARFLYGLGLRCINDFANWQPDDLLEAGNQALEAGGELNKLSIKDIEYLYDKLRFLEGGIEL